MLRIAVLTAAGLLSIAASLCAQGLRGVTVITAKIVLEDGTALTVSPLIIGESEYACPSQSFLDGTLRLQVPYVDGGHGTSGCRISVRLAGYRLFKGWVEDGTVIRLNREGPHEGDLVSAGSMRIPPEAKKRYEAGEAAAAKQKWAQAEQEFRAAVALEPKYALAWSELGRALEAEDRLPEAMESYTKSMDADPGYAKPVIQLAQASGRQGRWADEMRLSQQALKLTPAGSANLYFCLAQAAFHLASPADAEKLARAAIREDRDGSCPEAMALLEQIFEKQGNVGDAVVEYRAYLKAAPHGTEAGPVKEALARMKR